MTALPLSTSDQFLGSAGDIGHWTVLNGVLTNVGSGYGTIIPTAGAAFCYVYLPVPDYDSHGNPFCAAVATVADASALGPAYDVTVEPADYTGSVNFLGFVTDTLATGGTVTVTASPIAMTAGNTSIGMLVQIAPASGTFAGTEEFHISAPALSLFAPTPSDETGYCLTTLTDFGSNISSFRGIAVSPDETTLYTLSGSSILKQPVAGGSTTTFATVSGTLNGLAVDPTGNVYSGHLSGGGHIIKVTAGGAVTDPWITVAGITGFADLRMGRDGVLVAATFGASTADLGVVRVTLAGAVSGVVNSALTGGGIDTCTADSAGVVYTNLDPPSSSSPNYNVNTTLMKMNAGVLTELPIQALVDQPADGSTEAYGGIFCDANDHVIVPMVTFQGNGSTTADLSWFLRVTPAGVATRIASTWDYAGSPPPPATATNIADGKLGVSLACESDSGAGMSLDGKTLYFIDDGDQNSGVRGNLLRTLALCKPSGMLWLSDASPVGPANGLWTSGRRLHS